MRPWTLGTLVLVLALIACGYEAPSGGVERCGHPVERRDVRSHGIGGYELTWTCRGEGSPTIIAEAGYDSSGTSTFLELMTPMSGISRVCTYDRAGTGTSDPRPAGMHVTSLSEAKELHALLKGAAIAPPYILMAHSYGGFVARLFTATYQQETVGLILIDSSHENGIEPYRRYYGDSPEGDWVDGGDSSTSTLLITPYARRARLRGDAHGDREGRSLRRRAHGLPLGSNASRPRDAFVELGTRPGAGRTLRDERRSAGAAGCDPRSGVERSQRRTVAGLRPARSRDGWRLSVDAVVCEDTLGLSWQHTRASALLGWVGDDAAFLGERIARAAH